MKKSSFRRGLFVALGRLRRGAATATALMPASGNAPAADNSMVIRPERFNAPAPEVAARPKSAIRPAKKRKLSFARATAALIVILPTVLGAIYFGLIASEQYAAGFQLAVRSNDRPMADQLAAIPGFGSSPVTSDSYIVVAYLRSRQLVEDVSKKIDLRAMFQRSELDLVSRLPASASSEQLVEFWRDKIDVHYETQSTIITASIRAFRPEDSLAIARVALKLSESLVNDLSRKARDEAVATAESDVRRMELRLATSVATLKKFRDRTGVIDPQKGVIAGAQVIAKQQEELVRLRTQLALLANSLSQSAPSIVNLRQRIAAVEGQISNARGDVSKSAADSLTPELTSQLLGDYESLELERLFAEKAYTATQLALERARGEAARAQRYLSIFVEPHLPQDSSYPKRLLMILTVFAFSFIAWAISLLVFLTVKEHIT